MCILSKYFYSCKLFCKINRIMQINIFVCKTIHMSKKTACFCLQLTDARSYLWQAWNQINLYSISPSYTNDHAMYQ